MTPVPRWLLLVAASLVGKVVGDVALTADEVTGLSDGLLVSRAAPTGAARFSEWLGRHAAELGRHYR